MAQILAGQIVRAVDLNYPVVYQEPISGGPTSGTNELVVATLEVPAQPIDTIVEASATARVQSTVAGDYFHMQIRRGSTSGAPCGQAREQVGNTGATSSTVATGQGQPFPLPAGTSMTLLVTLSRVSGSGAGSVGAGTGSNVVVARVVADRS